MRAYCFSSDLTKSSFSSSGKKDALAALRFDSISLLVLTLKRFWHFWYSQIVLEDRRIIRRKRTVNVAVEKSIRRIRVN